MESDPGTVLIVDDDEDVLDVYRTLLERRYDVITATRGEEALDLLAPGIDVVLLDRRMPGLAGSDVLETIRESDSEHRVIMITAVDADFDIVDMPCDDYLCKPVEASELQEAIDRQLTATEYDDRLNEYFAACKKLVALENAKTRTELEDSMEYWDLKTRVEELQEETNELVDDLDAYTAFDQVDRD